MRASEELLRNRPSMAEAPRPAADFGGYRLYLIPQSGCQSKDGVYFPVVAYLKILCRAEETTGTFGGEYRKGVNTESFKG